MERVHLGIVSDNNLLGVEPLQGEDRIGFGAASVGFWHPSKAGEGGSTGAEERQW